jgi:hypothetical protein
MDLTKHGFVEMEGINILHSETGLEKADLFLLNVIISSC